MSLFMSNWRSFFTSATDASHEYCEATGLMVLSSMALGRRSVDQGQHGLPPNLFMMLSGDSSAARKTTSVLLAKGIVEELDPFRVGPRDYTVEGLLKWMTSEKDERGKTRNKVVLFAEEFGSDLARMEAYGTTMKADFCALYDGETFEKVRAKGVPLTISKPRVNLFAACAYDMLSSHMKARDWRTGYLMRFLYVVPLHIPPRKPIRPPWPKAAHERVLLAGRVLRDELSRNYKKVGLTFQAENMYGAWGQAALNYAQGNSLMTSYLGRFNVNALKIALLYQLDIDPHAPISDAAMHMALDFVGRVCWPSYTDVLFRTTTDDMQLVLIRILIELRRRSRMRLNDVAQLIDNPIVVQKAVAHLVWGNFAKLIKDPHGDMLVEAKIAPIQPL